jgi:hypothetical protein
VVLTKSSKPVPVMLIAYSTTARYPWYKTTSPVVLRHCPVFFQEGGGAKPMLSQMMV